MIRLARPRVSLALLAALALLPQSILAASPAPDASPAPAAGATLEVRVIAQGGKFLGDDIGGAAISVRDALTGELLASGTLAGGSGDASLMTAALTRSQATDTTGASVFTATIPGDDPRLVEVTAEGPLAAQGAMGRVSATTWVVPTSLLGGPNQVLLTMPGLNVDIVEPVTHFLPTDKPPVEIDLAANVTMMCGCPIAPDKPWTPDGFVVQAVIDTPSGARETVTLTWDADAPDGAPSRFVGSYTATEDGIHQVHVVAVQPALGNTGSDRVTVIVP